jgi:RimJ/RimL family protein N-acetyltransferase
LRGLGDRTGEATTSYFIVPDQSGRGYATEAVELVLEYGFDQFRLHRIGSYTMEFDEGSRRVLEKNGFSKEGTKRDAAFVDGMYCDVELWGSSRTSTGPGPRTRSDPALTQGLVPDVSIRM